MNKYNPKKIESCWQNYWEDNKVFEVTEDLSVKTQGKDKFYGLVEFPYPSGAGLHVGHPRPFTAMDVICRKKRMQGFNVLYPMGFDAFGLPTENFAIKTGRPPAEVTAENIANFTRQLKMLGYSFDWSRAVDTTDPKYYKWTQWIFLQLFKHGLAYKKAMPINWCPSCKIGLANEEVVDGKCERCGTPVEKKNKEQWMLAITKYADKLLQGLETVDYIPQAKIQQQNWIGRSEGLEEGWQVDGMDLKIKTFTTWPHTTWGATFMVIAPEHPIVEELVIGTEYEKATKEFCQKVIKDKMKDPTNVEKNKEGFFIGRYVINHLNGRKMPLYIANFAIYDYGTGIVKCTPTHDQRDFEFAKKYNLDFVPVIVPTNGQQLDPKTMTEAYVGEGTMINAGQFDGLPTEEARKVIGDFTAERGNGQWKVQYKLRDWVFSRQRYWGEPIPLVYCENCANKKQKVLIIHGWEGSGDSCWHRWMEERLKENEFEVFNPSLSNASHPNIERWVQELKPYFNQLGENDIVIGHSLGGKLAVHLLAQSKKKIGKVFLVGGTVIDPGDAKFKELKKMFSTCDVDSLKKCWLETIDLESIGKKVEIINYIISDDDPIVPLPVDQDLPKDWNVNIWKGQGHFEQTEHRELLQEFLKAKQQTGWIPLPESELPLELPKVKKYEPTDNGESPLAHIDKWVNTKCPVCGGKARRETDTMPNWAGSSWYFLRYCDPHNDKEFASMDKLKYWMGEPALRSPKGEGGVDWYNGGMEHTVLHLLYSRFWNEFLYDIGVVPTSEPYKKRTSHGMILASDGEKMSKSRGNVINPDEMVEKFGTDAFRTYIMFMGPFDQAVAWDTNGLVGVRRFLEKVWGLQEHLTTQPPNHQTTKKITTLLHQTIKKVSEDIEAMRFNTAVAQLMILVNEMSKDTYHISHNTYQTLLKLLSPFAPHLAEELWSKLGNKESISLSDWPEYDPELIINDVITVVCQINGKVRDEFQVPVDISEEEIKKLVLASGKVQKWLEGKEPRKVIYVKGKLVSIVV